MMTGRRRKDFPCVTMTSRCMGSWNWGENNFAAAPERLPLLGNSPKSFGTLCVALLISCNCGLLREFCFPQQNKSSGCRHSGSAPSFHIKNKTRFLFGSMCRSRNISQKETIRCIVLCGGSSYLFSWLRDLSEKHQENTGSAETFECQKCDS